MLDLGVELLIAGALYVLQSIGERVNVWLDRRSRLKQETGTGPKEETVSVEETDLREEEVNHESVEQQQEDYATRLGRMSVKYRPEKPDVELALRCKEYLSGVFPNGVSEKVQGMSKEELLNLFLQVEKDAEEIMDVSISDLDFYTTDDPPENGYYGYYSSADKSVHLNAVFILSGDPRLVEELIYTIFHELKHARQWDAMDGYLNKTKDYGYSEKQVKVWMENGANYIYPCVSDELYRKQPLENDAYGFASVVRGIRKFEAI